MEHMGDGCEFSPSEDELKEIKKIDQTINRSRKISPKIKKQISDIKDKKRNYSAITARLEEILDSYIIIGFDNAGNDNAGNDYVAVKAPTTIDNLGLDALLHKFINGNFSSLTPDQLDDEDFDPYADDD